MDYKKSKAPVNTVTRNIMDLCEPSAPARMKSRRVSLSSNELSIKEEVR